MADTIRVEVSKNAKDKGLKVCVCVCRVHMVGLVVGREGV